MQAFGVYTNHLFTQRPRGQRRDPRMRSQSLTPGINCDNYMEMKSYNDPCNTLRFHPKSVMLNSSVRVRIQYGLMKSS